MIARSERLRPEDVSQGHRAEVEVYSGRKVVRSCRRGAELRVSGYRAAEDVTVHLCPDCGHVVEADWSDVEDIESWA